MAWCIQATSHYLSQWWPRSMSPYSVTRPEWVKLVIYLGDDLWCCYHQQHPPGRCIVLYFEQLVMLLIMSLRQKCCHWNNSPCIANTYNHYLLNHSTSSQRNSVVTGRPQKFWQGIGSSVNTGIIYFVKTIFVPPVECLRYFHSSYTKPGPCWHDASICSFGAELPKPATATKHPHAAAKYTTE